MEYLNEVFNAGGHLSRHLDGYKPRPGQIDYAHAVDAAIRGGHHLMIEGPTGTGKTFAFGVAATYHAAKHGRRVLIVTSNIALQEQLMTKDLPLLAEAVPWEFSYRMLKGKANYLCLWRTADTQTATKQLFSNQADDEMADEIVTWSAMTPDGDKSGLPFDPPPRVWRNFSVSPDDCRASDCAFVQDCFSAKAREDLNSAAVVVTNYHVLFAHLKVLEMTGRNVVLPPFDVLIMDEGHRAPEIAREFLGFKLTEQAVKRVARIAGGNDQAKLGEASKVFFDALASHYRSGSYKILLQQQSPVSWRDFAARLNATGDALVSMSGGATDPGERSDLKRAARRAVEMARDVTAAMTLSSDRVAYFLEEIRGGGVSLRAKVVDVDTWLRENVFDNISTVVVTSATLAANGSFDYVAEQLGADHYKTLQVDSPFDWAKQALLVLPPMPDPKSHAQQYLDAVADRVLEAIQLANGRTLALFTSYKSLNHTHDRLRKAGLTQRIMRQGDLPRTTLVEEFKDDVNSVLLGTESFWSGVDVPGEALSCLVIDKLPFPNYGDPVIHVLNQSLGRRFFGEQYLPRAVIVLKQGVGRLIRTVDDYGVVVLLDPRVSTKGYGKQFIRSLPKMVKSRNMTVIGQFLGDMQVARESA